MVDDDAVRYAIAVIGDGGMARNRALQAAPDRANHVIYLCPRQNIAVTLLMQRILILEVEQLSDGAPTLAHDMNREALACCSQFAADNGNAKFLPSMNDSISSSRA
jgi:hypothetical protein